MWAVGSSTSTLDKLWCQDLGGIRIDNDRDRDGSFFFFFLTGRPSWLALTSSAVKLGAVSNHMVGGLHRKGGLTSSSAR